jgi:hypothetical protein
LTKENLAIEAGMDESTLFRKKDGKYMYQDVLSMFESGKPLSQKDTKKALRQEVMTLREQVKKLQRIIADKENAA